MNINFELYKIFYYVCQFKSITRTAEFLYVSQPAITKQIKNLEKCIGKTLIIKTPKGIDLTDDGHILYDQIKESVEKLNSIETVFKNKESEYEYTIRIIAGYSTFKKILLPIISNFNLKHKNIKFEINIYRYKEAIDQLREGKADLIFLNFKEDIDEYNDLIIKQCYEVEDIFVVNRELKDSFPKTINLLELNNYPIICKSGNSVSRDEISKYFIKNNMEFIPKYELSNSWLIEEYVNLNFGIGLLTREFIKDELNSKKLYEIKTDVQLKKRKIGYAIRKNNANYKILEEFISEIKNAI